jgi:hypothetical protein
VRWLQTHQFGVEFLRVPEDHKGLIGHMIRQELQAKTGGDQVMAKQK